ncbi:Phosducin-like protein 3 [Grifola frondosa]|uniref:Phosducin-like protein 3 n=1 Tax=Grifola frondosa TaxID=5627 RepID=A0A1C7ME70_GRIFR|nr:Phosducin-like protein 3 [Grifola frondosa]
MRSASTASSPSRKTPPSPSPPPPPTLEERLGNAGVNELRELEEEADDETARIIEKFRRRRLAEQRHMQGARFGRVYPIGRDDYTREVTEASNINEEDDEADKGTGVVCFLYKDGIPCSDRASEHVQILAQRHPHTKFVSIVGDRCIENLPDARLPMFIVYRKGEVLNQIVAWGADRERKIEELEAVLILSGAIVPQQRNPPKKGRDSDSEETSDQDDDDDPSSRMRSANTRTNVKSAKNIRSKKDDDSDSDFDFDL